MLWLVQRMAVCRGIQNQMKIKDAAARRIWDSRGRPTLEAIIRLEGGKSGRAAAPAGASRGSREAVELRDGGNKLLGFDVQRAIRSVKEKIAPRLAGMDATDQAAVDAALIELDGTSNKSHLGGNAITAVSLAVFDACASALEVPVWRRAAMHAGRKPSVPLPEIQIFGGGSHAGRRVDIQDFMVMVPGAASFDECLELTAEIYHAAGSIMLERGRAAGVADEGGWWPDFKSNADALDTLVLAIEKAGEKPGKNVVISLDVAASEFGSGGRYKLALDGLELGSDGMIDLLGDWVKSYPIISVEDPLAEDDEIGMQAFTKQFGESVQIVGDDFLVTNERLIRKAASIGACNAALLKVNQVGTVSETIAALEAAENAGWRGIVSARSGETEDAIVSHLASGWNVGQLKVGSFARSERTAKWNECLRIEEEIGKKYFAGGRPLENTWWGRERRADESARPRPLN